VATTVVELSAEVEVEAVPVEMIDDVVVLASEVLVALALVVPMVLLSDVVRIPVAETELDDVIRLPDSEVSVATAVVFDADVMVAETEL
jgi:hypothetical protein